MTVRHTLQMMKITIMQTGHPDWETVADFAAGCTWRAGAYLAALMRADKFAERERVIAAFTDGQPVGFCTLTAKDEMPDSCAYTPFIGFVFVDEQHRGQRISAQMMDAAAAYAGTLGYDTVYVTSDEQGFYEKFGFTLLGTVENIRQEMTQLFMKTIERGECDGTA